MNSTNTTPQEATVQRWAVIIRAGDGRGELLGTIYSTEVEAVAMGRYWQSVSQHDESAELVTCTVQLKGKPIPSSKDLLPLE